MALKKSNIYSYLWACCDELLSHVALVSAVRSNLQSRLHFKGEVGHLVCSTGFCVVRCRESVTHPCYVFFHLFVGWVNQQMDAMLTGSNYPAIKSDDVRALQIPLAPHPELTAMAEVLTEMLVLAQRREKTRALKQAMMQELLTGRTWLV